MSDPYLTPSRTFPYAVDGQNASASKGILRARENQRNSGSRRVNMQGGASFPLQRH